MAVAVTVAVMGSVRAVEVVHLPPPLRRPNGLALLEVDVTRLRIRLIIGDGDECSHPSLPLRKCERCQDSLSLWNLEVLGELVGAEAPSLRDTGRHREIHHGDRHKVKG